MRNYLDNKGRRRPGINAVLPNGSFEELSDADLPKGSAVGDSATSYRVSEIFAMAMKDRKLGDVIDATTGQVLRAELVKEARALEMEYFKNKNVYTKVPRAEAIRRTGKPQIIVKWVDVNKGDDDHPNYRSLLVAREI